MYTLFALLVLFGVVTCQVPRTCNSPSQWECREVRSIPSNKFLEYRRLYYDAINLRERRREEIEVGNNRSYYDELILWKENKMYRVDLKTRQCNVTVPYRPFFRRGTYVGEKFDYEAVIGASGIPNEAITILQFSYNTTTEARYTWVSSPDCIPIQNIHMTSQVPYEQFNYFDLSVGISDPMVWVPPTECAGLE